MIPIWAASSGFRLPTDNLVASYVAGVGETVAGGKVSAWDDQSGNGNDLAQATGANQPVSLPYNGEKYVYHPAVAGNYISTPNAAANQITGNISFMWHGKLDSITPAATQDFISKWGSASTKAYRFRILSTGLLSILASSDGTANDLGASSSASIGSAGIASNQEVWLVGSRDSTSGDCKFYYSTDGASFTQLGTTASGAAGAIFGSSDIIELGSTLGGSSTNLGGKTYSAAIYNGIYGTDEALAQKFDAEDGVDGDTSIVSGTTGETWTVNQSGGNLCYLVGKSGILFDGAAHWMQSLFTLNQPCTRFTVVQQVSWTDNDCIYDGGAANAFVKQRIATPNILLNAGAFIGAYAGPAIGADGVVSDVLNGASGALRTNLDAEQTGNFGTNNPGGTTLGATLAGASHANIIVREHHIYNVALSAAQRAQIIAGLMARHWIT